MPDPIPCQGETNLPDPDRPTRGCGGEAVCVHADAYATEWECECGWRYGVADETIP
jgi:hypothetical protein